MASTISERNVLAASVGMQLIGNHYLTPGVIVVPMLKVKQSVKQFVGEEVPTTLNKSPKTAEISLAGAHRSRTYRRHRKVPTNGFEVRGVHRGPSAPTSYQGSTWDSGSAIRFFR